MSKKWLFQFSVVGYRKLIGTACNLMKGVLYYVGNSIRAWVLGWVDLGVFGKKCFDFFGLQETVSRNSYMTPGLYRYSLAQPAILPPAQHMRGTSKMGSFNLSFSEIIFDK